MFLAWMLAGAGLTCLALYFLSKVPSKNKQLSDPDGRKNVAQGILTDLLLIHDIDGPSGVTVLPKKYKQRIESWLNPARGGDSYSSAYYDVYPERRPKSGSYRDVAKLLHELTHPPMDEHGEMPMLPSSIEVRIAEWLRWHRKALGV